MHSDASLQEGCDRNTDILWPHNEAIKSRLDELVPDQAEWDGEAVVMRGETAMKDLVLALRKQGFSIECYNGFEQALWEYEKLGKTVACSQVRELP
jgi:hypothetical protein